MFVPPHLAVASCIEPQNARYTRLHVLTKGCVTHCLQVHVDTEQHRNTRNKTLSSKLLTRVIFWSVCVCLWIPAW